MKETRVPPAWSANLVANSGNTKYGVSVIQRALAFVLGDVPLHLASSLKVFSWHYKFPDSVVLVTDSLSILC